MPTENIFANISAIILAAGQGRRIGKPKWQLIHEGKNFLEIIVAKLLNCGIADIVCVQRGGDKDIGLIGNKLKIAINPRPEIGMISSLYYGLQTAGLKDGYLIFPVDHPFVSEATITKLCNIFEKQQNAFIFPSYLGASGHPIIIPSGVAKELEPKYFADNLRQFLHAQKCSVVKVDVDDQGVLKNINFREDLK